MLRGLSREARRSPRNFKMRFLCCGSSLPSSRSAWADNSIFQAMPLQGIFEWNGLFLTAPDAFERAFCSVQVFQIIEVLDDGFANVETLGAPGAAGQFFKAFLNGFRKTDSQHGSLAIQV